MLDLIYQIISNNKFQNRMSIVPSKKKVQPYNNNSNPCIEALNNLAQSCTPTPAHPYSMLMQIVRKNAPTSPEFQTPSKRSKNITQVRFTPSTIDRTETKSNNISTKLSILKTKNQVRQKKIKLLTDQITKLTQQRVKVSNFKMQILTSLRQIQQIRHLYHKKNEQLQQIKQIIMSIKQQQLAIQRQTLKVTQSIHCIEYKMNQSQQNLKNQQQKCNAISYAVQSQTRKNKNLSAKFAQIQNQFKNDRFISKFSKQLFNIMILICQINNSQYLNKNTLRMRKKNNSTKNNFQQNEINLCFKNSFNLQKLPINLITICQIYMHFKLKNIDRPYLNKVSYFCNQIQQIFDYKEFNRIVKQYYMIKLDSNESTLGQKLYNQSNDQMIISQGVQNQIDLLNNKVQLSLINDNVQRSLKQTLIGILFIGCSCPCGKKLQNSENIQQLLYCLDKFFNICVNSQKYWEGCTKLSLFQQEEYAKKDQLSLCNKFSHENIQLLNTTRQDAYPENNQTQFLENQEDFL